MTNSTTNDQRLGRSTSSIVWTVSVLLHVAVLAALILWEPLGRGVLVFNREDADQRTEAVKERSERLLKEQQERRERQKLDRDTAKALKDEEERKNRRKIADDVKKIDQKRQELEEVRKNKLEQIANRPKTDIQDGAVGDLQYEAANLLRNVDDYVEAEKVDKEHGEELHKDGAQILWKAGGNPNMTPEQHRASAAEILDDLDKLEEQFEQRETPGYHSKTVLKQIATVREQARIVAGEFDADAYNDVAASNLHSASDFDERDIQADTPADAYDSAVAIEEELNRIRQDIAAAEIANSQNIPFKEAMQRVPMVNPQRPDLGRQMRETSVGTIGDLNDYRELLDQAEDETSRMAVRAESLVRQAEGQSEPRQALAKRLTNSRQWGRRLSASRGGVLDLTAMMRAAGGHGGSSGGGDSGGGDADWSGRGSDMEVYENPQSDLVMKGKDIYANVLPGRRFGPDSRRKGWLFIDTWYIIGPWRRQKGPGFPGAFPPEVSVDLDAEYSDGYVIPEKQLDGTLTWQFHQAEGLRVQPPVVIGGSVYYAYTDVYFENTQDMLLAIASDDAAKVWINDFVVWQDRGLSSWRLDEGFRKVTFQKGYNRVLVRFENGPGYCYFSMLICPPDALTSK